MEEQRSRVARCAPYIPTFVIVACSPGLFSPAKKRPPTFTSVPPSMGTQPSHSLPGRRCTQKMKNKGTQKNESPGGAYITPPTRADVSPGKAERMEYKPSGFHFRARQLSTGRLIVSRFADFGCQEGWRRTRTSAYIAPPTFHTVLPFILGWCSSGDPPAALRAVPAYKNRCTYKFLFLSNNPDVADVPHRVFAKSRSRRDMCG